MHQNGLLSIGDMAPNFSAPSSLGRTITLREFAGRYVVLYFFPKAFTPGCTRQAQRFRDNYPEIQGLGAEVVGVSVDNETVQCDFANKHAVTFPMIGDHDKAISRAYGAARTLLPFDKRVTYIVAPDQRIAARFEHEIQINKHLDDVLRFLREKTRGTPALSK